MTPASLPSDPLMLRRISLLHPLTPEALRAVHASLTASETPSRARVVLSQSLKDRVAFAWSGRFRLLGVSPKGGEVTLFTAIAGDAIGLAPALVHAQTSDVVQLVCDRAGMLLHMEADALVKIARAHPELCEAMVLHMAGQAVEFASRVFELSALDVKSRLRAELLRLARTGQSLDGHVVVEDAPTQKMLGAQIGAAREAVTRHLRELADDGLVVFKRGVIEFPDIERLRAAGDAEPG